MIAKGSQPLLDSIHIQGSSYSLPKMMMRIIEKKENDYIWLNVHTHLKEKEF